MVNTSTLRPMKRSRHRPAEGDLFVMQVAEGQYLYGRVVLADRPRTLAPMPGSNLIYVYKQITSEPNPEVDLDPADLLLPPTFINRLPWTTGLFRTIGSRPIGRADRLPRHCFRRWTGDFLDEDGNKLPSRSEPCGEWGLASYALLDRAIGEALNSRVLT